MYELMFNSESVVFVWWVPEYFPNFPVQLRTISTWRTMRWYGKWWISIEELFGIVDEDRKEQFYQRMDKQWLDEFSVMKHLKYIMENAYKRIYIKWMKQAQTIEDLATRTSAVNEWSKIKDYNQDESRNVLNFFSVKDKWRMDRVLAIK